MRLAAAVTVSALLVVPVGWMWWSSLVPSTYSVMDMGYADYGGGRGAGSGDVGHDVNGVSVATLTGPQDGQPDMVATLTAAEGPFRLIRGEQVDGLTLNGISPGPALQAQQGDLVEVTLVNQNVEGGVTLHWHGIDVPNAEDGVSGVTQDVVPVGASHVYRFVLPRAGTYWYHSHQVADRQVRQGLFGTFVVGPPREEAPEVTPSGASLTADTLVAVHTYEGIRTVGGRSGLTRVEAEPGSTRRLRVINTDNGPLRLWTGATAYRVVAIDGYDLTGPSEVRGQGLVVPAGGRADLEVVVPDDGVRVAVGGGAAVVIGPAGSRPATTAEPAERLDLLSYGSPAPLAFDPERADRRFEFTIGRRPGFIDGRPGFWWSINGSLFPDVPMFVVDEGDVVRMSITNSSGDGHPMHLHGHHAVVLSRNGVAASGSQWWVDSLQVEDGETYEIAFRADNPGIWMMHCHNLPHAAEGLVAHLAYNGVSEPYRVGGKVGAATNDPE